ncbi:MAG TPA: MFS transporter [Roseiflexaceae bacterium]
MKKMAPRGTMIASCASFFALGLMTAALGPALPDLAANSGSSLATIGGVITALFLGALISLSVAGPLNDRLGQRPVLIVGVVLLALGTLGIAASHWLPLTLLCAVVAGLGHGAIDISTNVLIAEVFVGRSAAALNLLNVFFGLGAVAGPAIAGLTLRLWNTALPALWIGAALTLLQAPLIPLLADAPRAPHAVAGKSRAAALFRTPLLWALGVLVLLYVGVENGIGSWTTAYLASTTRLDHATAALAASGFWLALTGGRVIAALIGTRLTPNRLLLIALIGAFAGGVLLVASVGNAPLTIAAVLFMGLCFGPVFPTTLAITTATFRQAPGTAASAVVAMGSFGGMLLPWLQGVLLERVSPAASVLLVAAGALGMLALHIGRGGLTKRRRAANDQQPRTIDIAG